MFAGEYIPIETKAEGHRPEENRKYFEAAYREENNDHQQLQEACRVHLWGEQMGQKSHRADFGYCPVNPAGKEHQGHGESHIEIGVYSPEQRLFNDKSVSGTMDPADMSHAGNQADPIGEQDEDKDAGKEPKGAIYEFFADDAAQELMQAFDHPFPKILSAFGHLFHPASGDLSKNDDAGGGNPHHDHGVADLQAAQMKSQPRSFFVQPMLLMSRGVRFARGMGTTLGAQADERQRHE